MTTPEAITPVAITPVAITCQNINAPLTACGWVVMEPEQPASASLKRA